MDPLKKKIQKFDCPIAGFQQVITGKYKLRILWDLRKGPLRYNEIKKSLSGPIVIKEVAPRVLSRELKALADLGLISRKDYGEVPPRVDYTLTPLGKQLLPIIRYMYNWGIKNLVKESVLKRAGLA